MAGKPSMGHADGRTRTSTLTHPGRTLEGTRQWAFDYYIHRRTAVDPDRAGNDAAANGGTPVDDSQPADEQTLRMEHAVMALAARDRTCYERCLKPLIDRVVAALLLLLFLPVLLVTALAVWMSLGSPILLWQARVGRDGRRFHMLKFRTMRPDRRTRQNPDYRGPERRTTHKSADDPRHTRLGRTLRKTSLDELPQLFNVLRGDMSLVGPRPELVEIVEQRYNGWQHARHAVKPGITGLWQVTERPNGRLMHECIEIDLVYIERLSLRADVAIAFKTPFALLRQERVV
jgi:lipopolysaccharide/colanic/teichoic acid biosynthesis glycosyltransferase